MGDSRQKSGDDWNMAATMVGRKMPPMPEANRPTVVRKAPALEPARAPQPAPRQQQPAYAPSQPAPTRGGSYTMLLVIIGIVAVLLIGGLLALLLYLSLK